MFSIDNRVKFRKDMSKEKVFSGGDVLLSFGNDILVHSNCDLDENCISMFPDSYYSEQEIVEEDILTGICIF